MKSFIGRLRIRERDGVSRTSLVGFDQHQQFTENLGKISPVNFIYDEEPIPIRVIAGKTRELVKYAVPTLQPCPGRAESLHEIFVSVTRMKLNHRDASLVAL